MGHLILSLFLMLSSLIENQNNTTYTGSTPANSVVKSFLGIPVSDSVDFVRWKLIIQNSRYHLQCTYGIGEANTNGFVNGGKTIEITGNYEKTKTHYRFLHEKKVLKAAKLNIDLLHLLNQDNTLMVGNSGWSYTLSNSSPSGAAATTVIAKATKFEDSIVFEGRTPCGVPGVVRPGTACYKLKWRVALHADKMISDSGTFFIEGTPWREAGGKAGKWKRISGKQGQTIYHLTHKDGSDFLYLLKLDDRILVFTDDHGKLLVGNEDFSYTLNRK